MDVQTGQRYRPGYAFPIKVLLSNYLVKVGWEAAMTPLTYKVVGLLKRAEHEDYFDRHTDFNPFTLTA